MTYSELSKLYSEDVQTNDSALLHNKVPQAGRLRQQKFIHFLTVLKTESSRSRSQWGWSLWSLPSPASRWAFLTVVSCVLCLNPLCLQWHTSCWIRVRPTDLIHLTSFFRVPSPNAVTSTGSSYQYRTLMIPPVSSRPACLRLPSAQSSMTHPCS